MTRAEMEAATLSLLRQVAALMVEVNKQTAELAELRGQQAGHRPKPATRTADNVIYLPNAAPKRGRVRRGSGDASL
jgi:hypothetical protein